MSGTIHQPARSRGEAVPVAFDRVGLPALRALVAGWGSDAGLAGARLDGLVLATNEVATNAVVHGPGHGLLRLWRAAGRLHLEISDEGTGLPDGYVVSPAEVSARSGRGLWLASRFCDLEVRAGAHGTAVELSIACAPEPAAAAVSRNARRPGR